MLMVNLLITSLASSPQSKPLDYADLTKSAIEFGNFLDSFNAVMIAVYSATAFE
jgi:hypothetical protein